MLKSLDVESLETSVFVWNIESSYTSGSGSSFLLGKTIISIAVESFCWISNSFGDTVQKSKSFVEVWAMLQRMDVKSLKSWVFVWNKESSYSSGSGSSLLLG